MAAVHEPESEEKTKTLMNALNLISRDIPLPPHLLNSVSSIYFNASPSDDIEESNGADMIMELQEVLLKQRPSCISGSRLTELRENRYGSRIQNRLSLLEGLPSSRGEDLQTKCLLEFYGLKLAELQGKMRLELSSEHWLTAKCVHPDKQLFDWSMMRLRRPLYGIGDIFSREADDQFRKKRDAERLSRLEEEERSLIESRKRKFFVVITTAVSEFHRKIQGSQTLQRQRNDFIQQWHGKRRQRATRAEKLRFQALKNDDEEEYMKMVKESKNERLTLLLEETNKLLVNLGAAVQRQKDSKYSDEVEPLEMSESNFPEVDDLRNGTPQESISDEDMNVLESDHNDESDLLDGQRQYNSAIHSIQEKVTEQPSILQGGELRPYQLEGLQWMLSLFNNNLNGILADEMGLGKTIQTISLIAYLIEYKAVPGPHLVVAPKAVLPNWINEFSTWAPSIGAVLYDGRQIERKAIREEISKDKNFNVLITHYDLLMRDKAFFKKINWQYMIVDEGHRLKNHECALARTLGSGYKVQRRLLLTGTPIQNSLQELWALLNFLLPNIFDSVQNFEEWFNAPFADRGDVSLTDEEELLVIRRLHQVIRPFILRRKKNEVEKFLPSKIQVLLKCDMSAWQKLYYQQVTDEGRVGLATGSGKSRSLQNLTMQLRKCCNHPYLFVEGYNWYRRDEVTRSSGKFELLDRLLPKLRKAGHRVLLFSQMTKLMDILEVYLQLNDFTYLRLDGTTKTEERGSSLKKFNAPDSPYFMFLLSTRAGGLGLNLQTADTVIIFDSDWNPQMDQQAEDRAHRIGQKKEVRVFVLVSVGSIEEVILERAKQKKGIDAKVIQAGLFNTTSTAQERREMLEEIMRLGTSSLGTDVPSETEINRLAARSDEEFWMFEKMDEERRQMENYRTRLMEEHEVPDWVYSTCSKEDKAKTFEEDCAGITGKRMRRDVVYADTLSDLQWIKAVENGEDTSTLSSRKMPHLASSQIASNSEGAGKDESTSRNANILVTNEATGEETYGSDPKRHMSEVKSTIKPEYIGTGGSGWAADLLSWGGHKKKRSSYSMPSSSFDSRGQLSNRRNGWI